MMQQEIGEFFATYSKDTNSRYIAVNEDVLKAVQAKTLDDIIGFDDRDLCWGHFAAQFMENDQRVIKTRRTHIFFENCLFNGYPQLYRAYKSPIIGHSKKVLGIHGISVFISKKCLVPLTKQQTACLKHLAMGLTFKQIAMILGLSPKTVEHYLNTVKIKLNCESRSELILQAIERGLVNVF